MLNDIDIHLIRKQIMFLSPLFGEHKINLDLSAMTAGVYNVTIQTETGSVTARLSVVK